MLIEKVEEFNKEFLKINPFLASAPEENKVVEEKKAIAAPLPIPKKEELKAEIKKADGPHSEGKEFTAWAEENFKKMLLEIEFDYENGKGKVVDIKTFYGDVNYQYNMCKQATATNKDGKRIIDYDYTISCNWNYIRGKESAEGVFYLKGVYSKGKEEPTVDVKPPNSSLTGGADLLEKIIGELKAKVKKCISNFVQDLNSK